MPDASTQSADLAEQNDNINASIYRDTTAPLFYLPRTGEWSQHALLVIFGQPHVDLLRFGKHQLGNLRRAAQLHQSQGLKWEEIVELDIVLELEGGHASVLLLQRAHDNVVGLNALSSLVLYQHHDV